MTRNIFGRNTRKNLEFSNHGLRLKDHEQIENNHRNISNYFYADDENCYSYMLGLEDEDEETIGERNDVLTERYKERLTKI